jgi:hypothetical protein
MTLAAQSTVGMNSMHAPGASGLDERSMKQSPCDPLFAIPQVLGATFGDPLWCAIGRIPLFAATVPRLQIWSAMRPPLGAS